ncbi:hypothetical protein KSP40_PGU017245 [Platanthera guangdongensis]|uniref:Uncharacterized protein n=1 Tax=Platanthera guangdongensis TaxID=2320717 RepID=A0ABR2MCA2_9ASPA
MGSHRMHLVELAARRGPHTCTRAGRLDRIADRTPRLRPGRIVEFGEVTTPTPPNFPQSVSNNITSYLWSYCVESGMAVIIDGGATLLIDTQHLRDISFRPGSIYQFIGELHISQDSQAVLEARVGRNVDGIDLNLYHQTIQLRRKFEADLAKTKAA